MKSWNPVRRKLFLVFLPGGGGGTSLKEANGDVPLNGVAFSIEFL